MFRDNLGKVHLLRRGGGDEDVLKKAHIFYMAPVEVIAKFSMPPPPSFKISNAPPPLEFGIEGV